MIVQVRDLITAGRCPAVRYIGHVASGLALMAFVLVLVKTVSADDVRHLLLTQWPGLLGAHILYCVAYLPMTYAWIILAKACGARARSTDLAYVFLISQIAKYLPGNVAQFVGRAWAGQARGISIKIAGTAMMLEVAGVLAACAIVAGTALVSGLVTPSGWEYNQLALPLAVGIAAVGALVGSVAAFHKRDGEGPLLKPFLMATACYLVLLCLLAGANILLMSEISGRWSWALAGEVAGAFAVSWLVGFVTPGSPAGLGLREITFFSILAATHLDESLVLSAVAFRLATVTGDLLAWVAGMVLKSGLHDRHLAA
jgi:uncharacterized membrane protein YbhN (UPF0104 family)